MLTIVVPMAGRGQRFASAGYAHPKPLIPVRGVPMIQAVIDNLRPRAEHRFVFLCLREHLDHYQLGDQLRRWSPGCIVLPVDAVTEGAACTVLCARAEIAPDCPLMIANCDQWVDIDIDAYLGEMEKRDADGLIMTMRSTDPKWSYVRLDESGWVREVAEKRVISDHATVGIYNYRRGSDFVSAAEAMIARDERVNGEFYVAPAYNAMIAKGSRIATFDVGMAGDGMYGLGVPGDLEAFEKLPVSDRVHRPSERRQPER
jgi:NDP-sugar pyrophosphorylase family protein